MGSQNIYSKRNVLIASGGAACLFAIGFLIYSSKQKAFYQQIWDKSGDGNEGEVFGDWQDVYGYDFWQPAYLDKNGISPSTLDYATTKDYAQKIYNAHAQGLVGNKQDDVVSVFNKLKNKTDVAKLSKMFNDMKFGSLKDYLKSFMEGNLTRKNYMDDVYKIILKLPK